MSQGVGPTQRHRRALPVWLIVGVIAVLLGIVFVPGGYWILGPLALIALIGCVRRAFRPRAGAGRRSILAVGALVATLGLLIWVFLVVVALQGGFE